MFIVIVNSSYSVYGIDWIYVNLRSWSDRFIGLYFLGKEGFGKKVSG